MVSRTSWSRASFSTISSSSGFMKRASAMVAERPWAASSSAAFSHSARRVPNDSSATLLAFADDAALADLERDAEFGHLDAAAFAARIAQRARAIVDRDLRRHHVHQFGFIGGRHDDEVRQAAEIGVVERAGMGGAVGADEAGAVDGEAHRQALDRHVVDDLVVAALQEGRVDRAERLVAFGGKAGRKGHRMLLGDADVEGAVGEGLVEDVDAGAGRHRGGDADDLVVLLGFLDEALRRTRSGRRARSAWLSPARRWRRRT